MARSNTAPAQETNPPDFLAWHVANKGNKGFWTRIGAAWFHRDRKGLSHWNYRSRTGNFGLQT